MTIDGKRAAQTDFNLHDEADLSESALDGVVGGSDGPTTNKRKDDLAAEVASLLHDTTAIHALEHAAGSGAGHDPAASTVNAHSNAIDALVQKDAATLGDLSSKLSTADMGRLVDKIGGPRTSMTDAQIDAFAQTVATPATAETIASAGTSSGDHASVSSFLHGAANAAVMQSHLDKTGDHGAGGAAAPGSIGLSIDPEARILQGAISSIADKNADTLVGLSSTLSSGNIKDLVEAGKGLRADETDASIENRASAIAKTPDGHHDASHNGIGAQVSTLLQDVATADLLSAELDKSPMSLHGSARVTQDTLRSAIETLVQKDATALSDLSSKLSTADLGKVVDAIETGGAKTSRLDVDKIGTDIGDDFDFESRLDVASYLHNTANSTVLQSDLDKLSNPGPAARSTAAETLHAAEEKIAGNADVTLKSLATELSSDDFIKLAQTGGDLGRGSSDATIASDVDRIAGLKLGSGGGGNGGGSAGDHLDGVAGHVASLLHDSSNMQDLSTELTKMQKSEALDPSTKSAEHALQVGIDTLVNKDAAAIHDLAAVLTTTHMDNLLDAMSGTGSVSIEEKAKDIASDALNDHGSASVSSFLHDAANATVIEDHLAKMGLHGAGGNPAAQTLSSALDATEREGAATLAGLSSYLSASQLDTLIHAAGNTKADIDGVVKNIGEVHGGGNGDTIQKISELYHGVANANTLTQDAQAMPARSGYDAAPSTETILKSAADNLVQKNSEILSDLSSKSSTDAIKTIIEDISHPRPDVSADHLDNVDKQIASRDASGTIGSYLQDAANTAVMRGGLAYDMHDVKQPTSTTQALELAIGLNTQKNETALGDLASGLTSAQLDKLAELAVGVDGKTTNADNDSDVTTIKNATAKTGADGQDEVTWSSLNIAKTS